MIAPGPSREPYDLRDPSGSSELYYETIANLADRTSDELERMAAQLLDDYSNFSARIPGEMPRSRAEHGVELLTLGLVRWRYGAASRRTPEIVIQLATWLYSLRSRFPRRKKSVDRARGWLLGLFFVPPLRAAAEADPGSLAACSRGKARARRRDARADLHLLIEWLAATGEFKEECLRLRSWECYLWTLADGPARATLATADALFADFRGRAERECGQYTQRLEGYRAASAASHRWSEDALLVIKCAAEYHVNMVAAELMNRGMRRGFVATTERVVLVPGCMRARSSAECRAAISGCDIECRGCDRSCQVRQLRDQGRRDGFVVRIVPHATSFTRWLARYQASTHTGIVPVACPLHLVAGGYEVRRLGLRAQCVLLDYCGCQNHWHPEGIPTAANARRVSAVATQ